MYSCIYRSMYKEIGSVEGWAKRLLLFFLSEMAIAVVPGGWDTSGGRNARPFSGGAGTITTAAGRMQHLGHALSRFTPTRCWPYFANSPGLAVRATESPFLIAYHKRPVFETGPCGYRGPRWLISTNLLRNNSKKTVIYFRKSPLS